MDKKRRQGYVTGLVCLVLSVVFFIFIINSGWNMSTQIMLVFALFFGGLGVGSLWKPDSIGAIASQILENIAKSGEEKTDSHNKQIQKKSSGGVQVMASQGAKVKINVASGKKEQVEKSPVEEKEFLCKQTIHISPTDGYSFDFELTRGDHLRGEIVSDCPIDIYFMDEENFDRWTRNRSFDYEDCSEGIFEAQIDYVTPRKGTWYVIIQNNGRKSARVEVQLYLK